MFSPVPVCLVLVLDDGHNGAIFQSIACCPLLTAGSSITGGHVATAACRGITARLLSVWIRRGSRTGRHL
jgi:hypothetical protein